LRAAAFAQTALMLGWPECALVHFLGFGGGWGSGIVVVDMSRS
jgi:hypothetical protein